MRFSHVLALLSLVASSVAQDIVNPTKAVPTVLPVPTGSGYTYVGCFNEPTHLNGTEATRALSGGKDYAENIMTATRCLSLCSLANNGIAMPYAGIEYGRECYCAQYLSRYSNKLNDSMCDYACNGNGSQICGGADALSLYNMTMVSKTGTGSAGRAEIWHGLVAVVMLTGVVASL